MIGSNYIIKRRNGLFVLTFTLLCQILLVEAFVTTKTKTKLSFLRRTRLDRSFSSILHATMRFEGDASSDVLIKFPVGGDNSILDWLHSPDSDGALLGSEIYTLRKDGLWDCNQPPVDWFGLQLNPVFVHQIDRSNIKNNNVSIIIVDARTDISNPDSSTTIIQQVMQQCSFKGFNNITFEQNRRSWTLSSDVTLTLSVPLPPYVPLPPGFNSIGSNIISKTCQKRARENLESVKESYLKWAARVASKP